MSDEIEYEKNGNVGGIDVIAPHLSVLKPIKAIARLNISESSKADYIAVNYHFYRILFNYHDETEIRYASVKLIGSKILQDIKIYRVFVKPDLPDGIVLINDNHIIYNYGMDFTLESCIIYPIKRLITLSNIVLSVPPEVYRLLAHCSKEKILDIISKDGLQKKDHVMVSRNDTCRSLNGVILDCEPVDQGLVDDNTKFTIVNHRIESAFKYSKKHSPETINEKSLLYSTRVKNGKPKVHKNGTHTPNSFISNDDIGISTTSSLSNFSISPFGVASSFVDFGNNEFSNGSIIQDSETIVGEFKKKQTLLEDVELEFQTATLTASMISDYTLAYNNNGSFIGGDYESGIDLKERAREFDYDDDQLFVCVSSTDLQELGSLSGDVVKMSVCLCDCCCGGFVCACELDDENETKPSQIRYARIFPFIDPNNFNARTVYMSPLLLESLKNASSVILSHVNDPDVSNRATASPKNKLAKYIPVAKEIILARVASPITMDRTVQHLFLSNLKSHFESRHRVVCKDQYIPILLDTYLARSLFTSYEGTGKFPDLIPQGIANDIAWFKVTGGTVEFDQSSVEDNEFDSASTPVPTLVEMVPGQQYMVDSSKTRMIQSGIVPDLKPFGKDLKKKSNDVNSNDFNALREYLNLDKLFSYPNINQGASDTFVYAKQLRKIFQTSFVTQGKIKLQTTILLTSMSRSIGKSTLVRSICDEYSANLLELDGYELLNPSSVGKTIGTIRGKSDRLVTSCGRLVIFIKHIDALAKKTDPQQQQSMGNNKDSLSLKLAELIDEYTNNDIIFITSSSDVDSISEIIRAKLKFEININVPSELERKLVFQYLLDFKQINNIQSISNSLCERPDFENTILNTDEYNFSLGDDVSIETLALQSAGLTPRDLASIVDSAKNLAIDRLDEMSINEKIPINELIIMNGGSIKLLPGDFETAINNARSKFSDSIGAPRIPNVKWEDVGGLDLVKDEIMDTIDMPLKHPELFSSGIKKRSGILFYGPPGTGKTLLAKAIATNFALNFFSVKGPELLNMYIGESEANVRKVFQKARDAKPCVVFFDELDSVAPKRGNQGDSGGVMDRIVSQLLAELDGMSGGDGGDGVFVVGATNRPDLLDEALLRPGRFDKMLYLGISDTDEKQAKIIAALSRKFSLDSDVDIEKIASTCPFSYTGADFYALCSDAMLNAMTRVAGTVDQKITEYNEKKPADQEPVNTRWWFDHVATKEDVQVLVKFEDFQKARNELVPSVSTEELEHYLRVRANFEGAKENGKKKNLANNGAVNRDGDDQLPQRIEFVQG
ncbi:unnamed protein product [[Candida] boidinii]|uniref:Peroxisomal ATPase PEX6 n=1 Tax=Candida boidinii TaxID=5477 RepID=A0A9W6WFM8_CANBO|nr:hypothetical protein B5S30_g1361 [[Candida] boidinii]GME68268.1 unnamed protein product [[Candida] boidinii]GMG02078.1 unnamed protein product [[Candida] boidinii]